MKKNIIICIILIMLWPTMAACASDTNEYTFSENLPERVVVSNNNDSLTYNALISNYINDYNKIASGSSPESMDILYTAESGWDIIDFSANESHIAWIEAHVNDASIYSYAVKTYKRSSSEVSIVFEYTAKAESDISQVRHLGLVKNTLYYLQLDYENSTCKIIGRDLTANIDTVFIERSFPSGISPRNFPLTFLTVKDSLLISGNKQNGKIFLEVYNTDSGELIQSTELPDYVDVIFGADYNADKDTFAFYFGKSKESSFGMGDGIGVVKTGETEIAEILTLPDQVMLYEDRISIYKDTVYYVTQTNASGQVADHYNGHMYDYVNHRPQELRYCFGIDRFENSLFGLFFDAKGNPNQKVNYRLIDNF